MRSLSPESRAALCDPAKIVLCVNELTLRLGVSRWFIERAISDGLIQPDFLSSRGPLFFAAKLPEIERAVSQLEDADIVP